MEANALIGNKKDAISSIVGKGGMKIFSIHATA